MIRNFKTFSRTDTTLLEQEIQAAASFVTNIDQYFYLIIWP